MKIKLFTHDDLDGVGCALVLKHIFETQAKIDVDVEYLTVRECDSRVRGYVKKREIDDYKLTFVTDLSVSRDTAEYIDKVLYNRVNNKMNKHIQLIDHHKTALELNEFSWATVVMKHDNGVLASGTSLTLEFILNEFRDELNVEEVKLGGLLKLVELIRQYDTWDWTREGGNAKANDLNLICSIYGLNQFLERYINFTAFSPLFNNLELALIAKEQDECNKYVRKQLEKMVTIVKGYYRFGVVPASSYKNEICDAINKMQGIDIAVAIDLNTGRMSFRTAKNIDLTKVVEEFGGGGHPKACGATINDDNVLREAILKALRVE